MSRPLLLCTDLDRTLLPNGAAPESSLARERFARLVARSEVVLAYVSGRDRVLLEQAIEDYSLPLPDYAIGDVGTSIYDVGPKRLWLASEEWTQALARDWKGSTNATLAAALVGVDGLEAQEAAKQNRHKLSYYVAPDVDREGLERAVLARLEPLGVEVRMIWSLDEPRAVGLLDILPAGASKLHAIEALIAMTGSERDRVVFCGDSGNDLEVLVSSIPSVLVANAADDVRDTAERLAAEGGVADRLYCARGGLLGMNGNYASGILEGVVHYHPETVEWMRLEYDGAA